MGLGLDRSITFSTLTITKHDYYYQSKGIGNKGRKQSESTLLIDSKGVIKVISNQIVLDMILETLYQPETQYGYRAMTSSLQHDGLIINHKKVYRIMAEYQLLNDRNQKPAKNYVKHRRVYPQGPLEVLEMDIKFQWVMDQAKYAFILTVIDCFTRKVLYWTVAYSIKQNIVKQAWQEVILNYLQPYQMLKKEITIEVRNDNDTRFAAKEVQSFFKENHLNQVFTHPYTPQENGHIESFHAILGRSLNRKEFKSLENLQNHLNDFYRIYNETRLHGSLDHLTPTTFWNMWNLNLIERKEVKNKPAKFYLKIPHYLLSGNGNLREVSPELEELIIKMHGPNTLDVLSVQRSPSFVSPPQN
ncbi:MAG: transposase [Cellulosilyticaceae bacterium]